MRATCGIFMILLLLICGRTGLADPDMDIHASARPDTLRSGEVTVLRFQFDIPAGFILYSMTTVEDGPLPLQVDIQNPALQAETDWSGSPPHVKRDPGFEKNVEYHTGQIAYHRAFRVIAAAGGLTIPVHIAAQLCDDRSCYTQRLDRSVNLTLLSGNARPEHTIPPTLPGESFSPSRTVRDTVDSEPPTAQNPAAMGLLAFLLMAAAAGLGALLTPCVFPMVPITVSFFTRHQADPIRHNLVMAAIYAASIVLVYSIPGVLLSMISGADAMQRISTHPLFNVFIGALLVFFGLNLLGAFELRLPSFLISRSAGAEQRLAAGKRDFLHQAAGVFFMAVTFTLVSFSCTVGFVGGWVLPLAARGEWFYPLIGMIAFSSAFALPFFLLAAFPSAATRLQGRAGDWMLSVKMLFGVLELAAALKFLSNLDLHFTWGIITRDVVLVVWTVLFCATALLVLRVFSRNHPPKPSTPSPRPGKIGRASCRERVYHPV
mgnify:CR=1 FL=1